MRYNSQHDRLLDDERRRLLREVSNERKMSWRKLGKIIKLDALMRIR